MVTENKTKNANYIRIIAILRNLRDDSVISNKEYNRAKRYYAKLTGSNIIIVD